MRSLVCVYVFAEITIFPRDKEMSRTEIFSTGASQQLALSMTLGEKEMKGDVEERKRISFSLCFTPLIFWFPPRAQFELIFSRSI